MSHRHDSRRFKNPVGRCVFEKRTVQGAYFALAAYSFWGFVPIYFKTIDHVNVLEIICHRIIWSVVLLLAILAVQKDLHTLRITRNQLLILAGTALLLFGNWLVFIYGILSNNIVETSLGYFINPLVSVFLGMIFLKESLRPLQWVAIAIAGTGIAFQLIFFGAIPWIALTLAFSFGFYGLLRKNLNFPSITGLTIENLTLLPIALGGFIWLHQNGGLSFGSINVETNVLLMLGGFVTSFPLLCFAAAVTRLSLTAAGMFQYLAPSLSLLIAIIIYDEPFELDRIITFVCIWCALAIFTVEAVHYHGRISKQLKD